MSQKGVLKCSVSFTFVTPKKLKTCITIFSILCKNKNKYVLSFCPAVDGMVQNRDSILRT